MRDYLATGLLVCLFLSSLALERLDIAKPTEAWILSRFGRGPG